MAFTVALINPQIPPNTGNIARLCAATGTSLHLVGDIGFSLEDKKLKRAGLDYWDDVDIHRFDSVEEYFKSLNPEKMHILSKKVSKSYFDCTFNDGDTLIFGSEIDGVDESFLETYKNRTAVIPMSNDNIRCLNLSTSVGIVLYEGLRQIR